MNFLQHINSERKEGQELPDKSFFSTDRDSTRRFISESDVSWATPCGLLCDDDTYNWVKQNCINNIFVVTEEHFDKLKTLHFYKECILHYKTINLWKS